MKLKPYTGKIWNVEARNEKGATAWTLVVAETPEQALKSFRWENPGHDVEDVKRHLATSVIVPD